MRSTLVAAAAATLFLALIACDGAEKPEYTESSPTEQSPARRSRGNTLIETPEYTGVIFSERNASQFDFLFDTASTEFWEPSIDEVSRAERCIRQLLVSVQQDPNAYQKEHAAYILDNVGEYRRQYVGIVVAGEKRIWCNAFFSDDSFPDWMHAPVYVLDGGNHFWQMEYVVSKDECMNFYVHGEA
jgi:hypothetical protein